MAVLDKGHLRNIYHATSHLENSWEMDDRYFTHDSLSFVFDA